MFGLLGKPYKSLFRWMGSLSLEKIFSYALEPTLIDVEDSK